jgi:hypothetical protein
LAEERRALGRVGLVRNSLFLLSAIFSMSDYVEARYALLVLRQAYCSSDAVARDLMLKLVTDLCPHYIPAPGPKGSKRTEALEALRSLALCFDHHVWPPAAYWESAHEAAQDWVSETSR